MPRGSRFGVPNIEQLGARLRNTVSPMDDEIRLISVEMDGDDGLIATFSDGTTGGYLVQELLQLRPCRERVREAKSLKAPQIPPTLN